MTLYADAEVLLVRCREADEMIHSLIEQRDRLLEQNASIPALLENIQTLTKAVNEAPGFLEAVKIATVGENAELRKALKEALDGWESVDESEQACASNGYRGQCHERIMELRKLLVDFADDEADVARKRLNDACALVAGILDAGERDPRWAESQELENAAIAWGRILNKAKR